MSWEKVMLGEISANIQTGPFGSQLHQSDYSVEGIPVVMPKDLQDGRISECSIARVDESHAERLKRHKIEVGNILYSRRGDVGKCAYATEKENGWLCGTGCLRVQINTDKADSKFVFYSLQLPNTIGWVEKHAVGSTMLNLNTSILNAIPLTLPDIDTQKRIADILSNYDNLIENNQKQIKLLEEAAQRLYKEWFVDLHFPGYESTTITDGVPDGWIKSILSEIAYESGKNEKKSNRDNYKSYLPIDCIPKKSLGYIQSADIKLAKSSLISFKNSDVIFGAMRPYFHKVVVARENGLTRSTCFVLNSVEKEMWAYLVMLLFSKDTIEYATQISVGTTMPYTRWSDLSKMPIIIPSKEICLKFNEFIVPIIDKINCLCQGIIRLAEARDRLLPKLMSGEIEV